MKYHLIAYLLAYQGEIEAESEEAAKAKVCQMCNYPPTAPIIIDFVQEASYEEEKPQA